MSFKLFAITDTCAIGDDAAQRRFVYRDKHTGQTMTLLEPLRSNDRVAALLETVPRRQHTMVKGSMRIVTTWTLP